LKSKKLIRRPSVLAVTITRVAAEDPQRELVNLGVPGAAQHASQPGKRQYTASSSPAAIQGRIWMALAKQTMTDEQRKSVIIEYLKAFDRAGKTWDGGSILDLFADDAQVYFPKWGLAPARKRSGRCSATSAAR
jgi:hypothetical protein